jgi:chromosome segregation ATPase
VVHAEVTVLDTQAKVNRQRDHIAKIRADAALCDSNYEAHSKEISTSLLERATANEALQQLQNDYDTHQTRYESSLLAVSQLTDQQSMFRTLLDKLDHGDANAARYAFTPKTDQLGIASITIHSLYLHVPF